MRVLRREEWLPRVEEHRARARRWTTPHLQRSELGVDHPVEDFLFEYYNLSPGRLERWHPGLGVGLLDAPEHASLASYVTADGVSTADPARLPRRRPGLAWTRDLLNRTLQRPAALGCFGLHEWAMVYRTDTVRHPQLPLRLGPEGTADVVDSHRLACTHVDAFRFFTSRAQPLNEDQLHRSDQLDREQPGCLHAGMDLYRIAFRMLPFVEAGIVLDAFELARDIRHTDMAASPYDLGSLDIEPVRIETAQGKAEYVRRQRAFTERAQQLRRRLLALCEDLLPTADASASLPT
ncbi:3-methyladenine DNA glycosylase [Aeromicrobium sp. CF4.19]|uniref:3-methyladenine DNA glycosylase n=1 Tax=Aeromicrobium sp. CF4.19 TaxID=3373082 RepID=UPI003EE67DD3